MDTSQICGRRLFRALGPGVVVASLLLAMVASPVRALGEWIDLDPESGRDGDTVRVSGEAFNPSYQKRSGDWVNVYVRLYFSSDEAEVGDRIDVEVEDYEIVDKLEKVDKYGEWKVSFTVPRWLTDGEDDEDVEGGTYYVYVTYKDDDEIVALEEFDIRETYPSWSRWWGWSPCGPTWHWYYSPWYGRYYYDDWCGCPPYPWPGPCPDDWDYYPCPPYPWTGPCPDDCDDEEICPPFPRPPMPDWDCRPDGD